MSDEGAARLELERLLAGLDLEVRRALGDEWSSLATETYAGVARFAHFALELLSLAAPPELLERANRAALDELARARSCFALASIYAGRELGPHPLPWRSLPAAAFDLASVVERVVRQGCVAEALALAEFQLIGTRPLPAAVARVHSLMLTGAAEKLELACAFVRFALAENEATARPAADRAFEHTVAALRAALIPPSPVPDAVLCAHGRITAAERAELRGDALAGLVQSSILGGAAQ
jgi:hypothetical protein